MTQTNNQAHNNESPQEIRADIERTRGRMSENIDKIQSQLHPDNLKQQAQETVRSVIEDSTTALTDYVKQNSREIGSGVAHTIKRNPLPAALIGLGIGWLLVENFGDSQESSDYRRANTNYRTEPYGSNVPSSRLEAERWQNSGYQTDPYGTSATYQSEGNRSFSNQYYAGIDVETAEQMGNVSGYYPHEQQQTDYEGNIYRGSAYQTAASQSTGTYYNPGTEYEQDQSRIRQAYDSAKDAVKGAADSVRESAHELGERVKEGANQARAQAREVGHQAQHQAEQARWQAEQQGHSMQNSAHYYSQQARNQAQQYSDQARYQAHRAGDQLQEYAHEAQIYAQQAGVQARRSLQDNPLIFGGVALGIGALLGLVLPATRIEHEAMGETSRQVRDSAREVMHDVQNRAQHVAEELRPEVERVASQVSHDIQEAGRTAMHDLEDAGKTAMQDVKQSGKEATDKLNNTWEHAKSETQKQAEGAKETAKHEADKVKEQGKEDVRSTTSSTA